MVSQLPEEIKHESEDLETRKPPRRRGDARLAQCAAKIEKYDRHWLVLSPEKGHGL
jgi:hypothetical protein